MSSLHSPTKKHPQRPPGSSVGAPPRDDSMCSLCLPQLRAHVYTDIDSHISICDVDVRLKTTQDGLMFNASDLYREQYRPTRLNPEMWRIALRSFMVAPAMRGVLSLIRQETLGKLDLPLTKRIVTSQSCEHDNGDLYLHIGLLTLALLDLCILDLDVVPQFHLGIRDLVSEAVREYYDEHRRLIVPLTELEEVASIQRTHLYGFIAENIIDLAKEGKITMGGTSVLETTGQPIEPSSWLGDASPRTFEALTALSPVVNNPVLSDARLVLDVSLHVLYTSLAALLAKHLPLYNHCRALGLLQEAAQRESQEETDTWPENIEDSVNQIVTDTVSSRFSPTV